MGGRTALGRRRGTRQEGKRHTTLIIGLVFCMLAAALLLGMLLGTHVLATTSTNDTNFSEEGQSGGRVVGVHNMIRGGKTMDELNRLIRLRNEQRHKEDGDDQHLSKAKAFVVHSQDDDTVGGVEAGEEDEGEDHDHAADAASGKSDEITLREHPAPTEPYPYSLDTVPESYDFTTWTAKGGDRFAEYKQGGTPWIVTDAMIEKSGACARSRRYHVKQAMKHAWTGYSTYAFGHDEVLPVSQGAGDNWGGMGTTLVDSLDTLWLMDLKDEFWKARDWVRDSLNHGHVSSVSVFETTIRSLGGLLSAYDWSGDKAFLDKAQDLGGRLFKAFNSPSGLPFGQVSLSTGTTGNIGWAGGNGIVAEMGTLQVEFRYLARATNEPDYATKSEKVFDILNSMPHHHGLFPYYIRTRANPPTFANNKLTFGAMADSLYEYMLKVWLQGGKKEPLYRTMYDQAIQTMHDELLQTSTPTGLTYIADKAGDFMDHKMDHLVCFMGGLLALGAYTDPKGLESPRAQRDLQTAKALTYTCYQMYARMNTGISPEYIQFYEGKDFSIGRGAPHYLLRPEAVESFYILNFLTGDPVYREWGWEVFCAIERYCKTKIAYGQLRDVSDTQGPPQNKMESFFLAETLKYLYLLQDPDSKVDILHKHVFNTEAHPTRIFPVFDQDASSLF
eukprot:CAMPEP_0116832202 /NCGR_PEP_ID=MMETSP0418-20121206/5763_1 /TAXON_ID=1158023 /ORGANISM="Astrosyne radiata, Strain 13vi08-1A" /LENGTH=671 /DNA_ID=CAMNT_0004461541 /DNA_START=11 /DNA_END=2026 /DNA_ORIENTATION=+